MNWTLKLERCIEFCREVARFTGGLQPKGRGTLPPFATPLALDLSLMPDSLFRYIAHFKKHGFRVEALGIRQSGLEPIDRVNMVCHRQLLGNRTMLTLNYSVREFLPCDKVVIFSRV